MKIPKLAGAAIARSPFYPCTSANIDIPSTGFRYQNSHR